jgi:hypothetical protein
MPLAVLDLCCEKPGEQATHSDGPYLHKADRMKKIFLEPLPQGCREHRNVMRVC